jgi:trehalose 6-phosphate phosphatase
VELKPPVDWDKGAAVRAALPGLAGAWYFGDDLGDIPAFAALAQATAAPKDHPGAETDRSADRLRGFRVAVTSPESDHRLVEQSQYQVDGPAQVPVLLERIIAASQ